MKYILFLLFVLGSFNLMAAVNPSSVKLTIYGVALSTNADCSNATVLSYSPSGTTYDFMQNPAIISGNVSSGTYPCVILYMSNVITHIPATSDGVSCVAGTSYSGSICNLGNACQFTTASPNASNVLVYGGLGTPTSTSGTDSTHIDKMLLFLSTSSTGSGSTAFQQPTSANWTYGIKLGAPFVMSSSGGGTFVVNFNNQVISGGGTCNLNAPSFSFR